MELIVKIVMARSWNKCFPGFYESNLDEVYVDDVRNLVPYYARPDPDLDEILKNSDLLEETLTNWFLGEFDKLYLGVDKWFIVDAFEATKQNCGVLDNVMNNVVEATSDWHFDQFYDYLNVQRFDFLSHDITLAWHTCHPDHFDTRKSPETEMNVDWLIHLLSNNELFSD